MERINKLAIFDLDGTLVDSVLQIASILNRSREAFGYSTLPIKFYEESVGLPLEQLITDLRLTDEEKGVLVSHFRAELVRDISSGNNPLFEGVIQALDFLTEQGVQLAIATSKPTHIAREVYRCSELSRFDIHIQGTDGFPAKPNPDVINRVLNDYPQVVAVMIGDRTEDVTAAKGALIPSIGISASAHSQRQLAEAGAMKTFESFNNFSQELLTNSAFIAQMLG